MRFHKSYLYKKMARKNLLVDEVIDFLELTRAVVFKRFGSVRL